jgi:hypothetical protein
VKPFYLSNRSTFQNATCVATTRCALLERDTYLTDKEADEWIGMTILPTWKLVMAGAGTS